MAPADGTPRKRTRKPAARRAEPEAKPAAKPKPAATKPAARKPVRRARPEPEAPAWDDAAPPSWEDDPAEWGERSSEWGDPLRGDSARTLGDWLEAIIPPEAQVHFLQAGQEFLTGVALTVDHHANRGRRSDPGGSRAVRIEID